MARRTFLSSSLPALWLIPTAVLLALFVGPILRDGMFIDGLAYTNAAKNMSQGVGRFWQPSIDGAGSVFYGHPPLLLYLESLYFRVFGNHLYTEDLYNATVLLLTLYVMFLLWRRLAGAERTPLFFFPLLLFALNQEAQLRYPNTMLECGLTLILLTATYGYFRLVDSSRSAALAVIGLGVFVAFLAKGPAGLFLLGMPFLYRLLLDRQWSWKALLLPVLTAGLATALLLLWPDARDFLITYLDRQVLAALSGRATENVADSRFSILFALLQANIPGLLLSGALLAVPRTPLNAHQRAGWLLILVGLSAVVPYIISTKQAAYYQLPALPFLCLGAGLLLAERLDTVVAYLRDKRGVRLAVQGVAVAGVLIASVYALSLWGTVDRRDRSAWAQADAIARVMDSLAVDSYELRVAGIAPGEASSLSYPLPGTLNRRYDLFAAEGGKARVCLLIAEPPRVLPPPAGETVLYAAPGVRLFEPNE